MRIVPESTEIMFKEDKIEVYKKIEQIARVCYQSEDKITDGSAIEMIKKIMARRHYAMLEHYSVSVKFIADRGFTHAAVRHRIGAQAQESTIYCNYSKGKFGGEIAVIRPQEITDKDARKAWQDSCEQAEKSYMEMLARGVPPGLARAVLPTCTKAVLVSTYDLRQWRHFLTMRADPVDHPLTRRLAFGLLSAFQIWMPEIFNNVRPYSTLKGDEE